jgi:hypothetical protein
MYMKGKSGLKRQKCKASPRLRVWWGKISPQKRGNKAGEGGKKISTITKLKGETIGLWGRNVYDHRSFHQSVLDLDPLGSFTLGLSVSVIICYGSFLFFRSLME